MTQFLNLVFCGTPRFAVPILDKLAEAGFAVRLVVTQPDKPRGRGLELAPSPVKRRALELDLPITQPETIKNNEEFRAQLTALKPDAIIVVGYGRIIPRWMIELPRLGNINLHASLLPKYRGAAPIQWAIANGESVTGVTTMRIDAGLDTGDILLQKEAAITPEDTAENLAPRLAAVGAELMVETLHQLASGTLHPRPQDHAKATLAPILKKEDGRIEWRRSAQEICNRLRGFQPWPGAFTSFRGKNLNIWAVAPVERRIPQGALAIDADLLIAGCGGDTALELREVQPEGRKRMSAVDFIHGYHPQVGERLDGSALVTEKLEPETMNSPQHPNWGASYRLIASEKWKAKSAAMGRDVTEALVEYARPQPGMKILDLASGTGEPAISLAARVGPSGHVTALDLSPELLEIAADRARQRGFTNLSTQQADAHSLPFPDERYDLATSRFGVMFFRDPARALSEVHRVLKPGARACFLAWGPFEQPYWSSTMGVVVKHVGGPATLPGGPDPFRFAQPGSLSAVLRDAAFEEIHEETKIVPWTWPGTIEQFWEYARAVATPFLALLERVPEEKWPEINREVHAAIGQYVKQNEIRFTATVVLASGTR